MEVITTSFVHEGFPSAIPQVPKFQGFMFNFSMFLFYQVALIPKILKVFVGPHYLTVVKPLVLEYSIVAPLIYCPPP